MNKLKLGMIGLSKGNGHPYSWSAIFNGYNPLKMADCGYPTIPIYLEKQSFPEDTLKEAMVTHIWTQDSKLSQHIAESAYIPQVVEEMETMIPQIDGVLLARDDAENHIAIAKPFLEAGLPIYIDKPIALTLAETHQLFSLQKFPGQIFTCSALQYAREFVIDDNIKKKLKEILHIEACIKNDWNKYAIHLIEPIINIIGYDNVIKEIKSITTHDRKMVIYLFNDGLTVEIKTFQGVDIKPTITLFGKGDIKTLIFEDSFSAFKAALAKFIENIKTKKEIIKKEFTLRCIEMLEGGNNAT